MQHLSLLGPCIFIFGYLSHVTEFKTKRNVVVFKVDTKTYFYSSDKRLVKCLS